LGSWGIFVRTCDIGKVRMGIEKGRWDMKKLAVVTGATAGIGRATTEVLASDGYRLALAARHADQLRELAEELQMKYNADVSVYQLDVRDWDAIHEVAADILAKDGTPDVLVNNAGLARGLEPYALSNEDDILEMLETNIKGLFLLTRAFLPAMLARNTGHIVNLGSTAGLYAYAGAAVYCATKAAVKTFSDGLRIDLMESDLKVTTIQPGLVETGFSEVRFHGDKARAAAVYAGIEALRPEDIADVIQFVLSRPKRVQLTDVVIMANQQGTGFLCSKKP
jgi:3-hydroxy acid dehydrogenase / malonic semialdehyde reductase